MFRSAALVGGLTLVSRITGLFQSRILAHYLGVGLAFDAYSVAVRIPNLLRRFAAEGTMTSAFLPTVSEVENTKGVEAARNMVARFLGTLAMILLLVCALSMLAMGLIVGLQMLGRLPGTSWIDQSLELLKILTGRGQAPRELVLTTSLARIMFPYLALVSLTAGLAAVLNLKGRFGLPASVSTFWNLTFLAVGYGAMHWGPPSWRDPVQATFVFAVAVILGGIVQLAMLWPSFRSLGYSIRWGLHFRDLDVRRALKRMTPGILGTGIHPINVLISTALASQLAVGAQGVLFNSNMMGEMVLGLFSASLATVSLLAMSRLVDAGDLDGLRHSLASALRGTALMAIPASVGLAVLAQPILAVLLQTGRFGARDVAWTASTLTYQSVGLLFIATSRLVAQCLYAMKDYRTPAYAALLGMLVNIALSILLMKAPGPGGQILGTGGIALANGLSSLAGLSYLGFKLSRRLPAPPFRPVLQGWLRMGLSAAVMGLVTWWAARTLNLYQFQGVWRTSLRLFPLMGTSALLYFGLLLALRVPEARDLGKLVLRKLRP
jgi:putative peptidoglycan lipid II flippase